MTASNRHDGSASATQTPESLRRIITALEDNQTADEVADRLQPFVEQLTLGSRGRILRGDWLGHAAHPMLTDVPLGCWTAATLLDIFGGRRSAPAAQRLVGLGLMAVPITVATGMADLSEHSRDPRIRRVGVIHAATNTVAAMLYFASWNARRSGSRFRGICLALMAGTLASFSGYLGGHLSFARAAGQGERGLDGAAGQGPAPSTDVQHHAGRPLPADPFAPAIPAIDEEI